MIKSATLAADADIQGIPCRAGTLVAFFEYGGELQHCTKFDRSRLVDSQNGKMRGPTGAETRCFVLIKAYLCRRRLSHLTSSPGQAGLGGARSWAINIRISWNICRGTATSAI
jgi:hypothetical protein